LNAALEKRFDEIHEIVLKMGLDPFPICFEEVPREVIWDVASYGLPTRMSHWSFGRSFLHQKIYGEMGYSKIYELIVNNNPSYAFLDETNSDVQNLLICAHVEGHASYFKHNLMFAPTNRNMVNQAEANAKTIEEFKQKYGVEVVEDWMDIAFSLENHIDWHRGENRKKYPPPEHVFTTKKPLPYADLFGEDTKPQVKETVKNMNFPPHAERDLLWFLVNYAQMLPWQREVFDMIRSEQFYFFPQVLTKIGNEGFSVWVHAEVLLNYWNLTPAEHLDFAICHAGIVRPGSGGSLNPYYIGFKIYTDIKKRWDKYYEEGKKDAAFQKMPDVDMYDKDGKVVMSKIDGFKKILKVVAEDDDISFVNNYLTRELCEDMELFVYGYEGIEDDPEYDDVIIKDRELQKVKEVLVGRLHNGGAPLITIRHADESGLYMNHDSKQDPMPLDPLYTRKTMEYMFKVWKRPVILATHDEKGNPVRYVADKKGVTEEAKGEDGSTSVKFRM